jgi:hypothetical protein
VITLLTTSDCPSVCRWKAELIFNVTPASLNSSDQNVLVNTVSWSLTIDQGIPWSLTMLLKKALTTDAALYGWLSAMKCVN